MRTLRLRSLSFVVAASICLAAAGLAADGEQTDFAAALAELDRQARRGQTTVEKLEESYLQLLDLPLSPEQ